MNHAGVERKRLDYDGFGRVTSTTDTNDTANNYTVAVDQLFRYTGRYTDEDTGLQNNLHRWYDSKAGRWLSEDPIGFAGGDENLYRYVGNEPTGKVDPNGLEGIKEHLLGDSTERDERLQAKHRWHRDLLLETTGDISALHGPARLQGELPGALLDTAEDAAIEVAGAAIPGRADEVCAASMLGRHANELADSRHLMKAQPQPPKRGWFEWLGWSAKKADDIVQPAPKTGVPTNLGPFGSKAPKQVTPGTRVLEGHYVDDLGRCQPWRAHYDEYGRQIWRTDFNSGNRAAGIPDVHHHRYEYNAEFPFGRVIGSHIPGEFTP